MEPPLLVTHTDMDGSCCAICFREIYGAVAQVLHVDYARVDVVFEELLAHPRDGLVVVADISSNTKSLNEEVFARLGPERVRFFDHHRGNDYFNDWPGSKHDLNRCGGLILAEVLGCPDHCINFAEIVDCYDRWQVDSPNFELAQDFNLLHKFIGQDRFITRGAEVLPTREEDELIEILKERQRKTAECWIAVAQLYQDAEGRSFLFLVDAEPAIAHLVLRAKPEVGYAVVWNPLWQSLSFYSDLSGPDVCATAKRMGGGGHTHAAGCTLRAARVDAVVTALLAQ
jgi:uncharacterized protein